MTELFFVGYLKAFSIKAFIVDNKQVNFNATEKSIYMFLMGMQKSGNNVAPSQEYLATCFGLTIKGTRDCLKKLELLGLITKTLDRKNGNNYTYKVIDIFACGNIAVYPDHSKELKTSNGRGSTLKQSAIDNIRGFSYKEDPVVQENPRDVLKTTLPSETFKDDYFYDSQSDYLSFEEENDVPF